MNNIDSITLKGKFERYLFQSKENDYFIALINLFPDSKEKLLEYLNNTVSDFYPDMLGDKNQVILTGNSLNFIEQVKDKIAEYCFTVKPEYSKKYDNYQMSLITFFEPIPTSEKAMVQFLSKKINGIGETTAKKIIQHFGLENIEDIFDNNINRLLEIKRIKEASLKTIQEAWKKNRIIFDIMNYLKDFDIPDHVGVKIYNKYELKSLEIIQKDPYSLCLIDGVTFKVADKIAQQNGIPKTNSKRIQYGLNYIMKDLMNKTGNTLLSIDKVLNESIRLLDLSPEIVLGYINALIEKEKIIQDGEFITVKKTYEMEKKIFDIVMDLSNSNLNKKLLSEEKIVQFEKDNKFNLDESQLASVVSMFRNNFNILTGIPGSGKTTTIKSFTTTYIENGFTAVLLAPTGKAAQRMTESTGMGAETIHRFLELLPEDSNVKQKKEEKYIDYDLVVVDESSMIDLYVASELLKRINPRRTAIVFVGDINQLPPVGSGYFFRDLINSGLVNVCRLNKLHRTSENSSIAVNSRNLIMGKPLDLEKTNDFEYIRIGDDKNTQEKIEEIYAELIENNVSPLDIQILSPVKEKTLGCKVLNESIRPIANSNYNEVLMSGNKSLKYIMGDKVMQQVNNYDLLVFNGDTGMIKDYDIETGETIIEFGNPDIKTDRVNYNTSNLSELDLAYCITVHKSQGSDYPYVIIPLSSLHYMSWNVKLLYTAITRAKKKLFLVGSKRILDSINNKKKNEERVTNLQNMFSKVDLEQFKPKVPF